MDTQTGKIVNLDEEQARQAEMAWRIFEAGLTKKMPRYAPIKDDKIPYSSKRKKRRTRGTRSYKDFCR